MGEKDVIEKSLAAYNDVFADIVNILLFDGEEVVKEEDLTDAVTSSGYNSDNKIHVQERDVAKYWNNNDIRIAFIGSENQTDSDKYMPLRVMGYDGAAYRSQYSEDIPITLILYFGYEKHWSYPKNLLGCMEISEKLRTYVNDYNANIFEIAFLEKETINKFKSDFKIVSDYFYQSRVNDRYNPPMETIKHVYEVLKILTLISGDNKFIQAYNEQITRKGAVNMDSLLTRTLAERESIAEKRGREEGRSEGEKRGLERGRNEEKSGIALSMKKKGFKLEDIIELTGLSREKVMML